MPAILSLPIVLFHTAMQLATAHWSSYLPAELQKALFPVRQMMLELAWSFNTGEAIALQLPGEAADKHPEQDR